MRMNKILIFPKLEISEIIIINGPCYQMALDIKCLNTLIKISPDIRHENIPIDQFHIRYSVLNDKDVVNVDQTVRLIVLKFVH